MKTVKLLCTILCVGILSGVILSGCSDSASQYGMKRNPPKLTVKSKTFGVGETVTAVACGENTSFVLTSSGNLYATGDNGYGQLGLGDYNYRTMLTLSATNVKAISAGYSFSLIIKNDGCVYATGYNYYGQLGLGNNATYNIWQKITSLSGVKAIACGNYHSLALTNSGSVYVTGRNNCGQFGLGNNTDLNTWKVTVPIGCAIAIAAGGSCSLMIGKNDGAVYGTGVNNFGQLGLGNNTDTNTWQQTSLTSGVKAIACSNYAGFSLALTNDGHVFATGEDWDGEIGFGSGNRFNKWTQTSLSNVVSIACGWWDSLALTSNGDVYGAGQNTEGELGFGNNNFYPGWQKSSISGVNLIAAGDSVSLAVENNRNVYGVGANGFGELGQGSIYPNRFNTWQLLTGNSTIDNFSSNTSDNQGASRYVYQCAGSVASPSDPSQLQYNVAANWGTGWWDVDGNGYCGFLSYTNVKGGIAGFGLNLTQSGTAQDISAAKGITFWASSDCGIDPLDPNNEIFLGPIAQVQINSANITSNGWLGNYWHCKFPLTYNWHQFTISFSDAAAWKKPVYDSGIALKDCLKQAISIEFQQSIDDNAAGRQDVGNIYIDDVELYY